MLLSINKWALHRYRNRPKHGAGFALCIIYTGSCRQKAKFENIDCRILRIKYIRYIKIALLGFLLWTDNKMSPHVAEAPPMWVMTNTKESLTGLISSYGDTVLFWKAPSPSSSPSPFVVLMNERQPERQPAAEDRRSISGCDERPRWQSAETLANNLPGEAAGGNDARRPDPWAHPAAESVYQEVGLGRCFPLRPPSSPPAAVAGLQLTHWQTRRRWNPAPEIHLENMCPCALALTPMRPWFVVQRLKKKKKAGILRESWGGSRPT